MLPADVAKILTGSASRVGGPLIGRKPVRNVNFTGSVEIGHHVMRTAAEHITPVGLEMGGNDAGLILQDAMLDDSIFEFLYCGVSGSSGLIYLAHIDDIKLSGLGRNMSKGVLAFTEAHCISAPSDFLFLEPVLGEY